MNENNLNPQRAKDQVILNNLYKLFGEKVFKEMQNRDESIPAEDFYNKLMEDSLEFCVRISDCINRIEKADKQENVVPVQEKIPVVNNEPAKEPIPQFIVSEPVKEPVPQFVIPEPVKEPAPQFIVSEPINVQPQAEPKALFCVYCGTKLDDDSVFCVNCGKRVEG